MAYVRRICLALGILMLGFNLNSFLRLRRIQTAMQGNVMEEATLHTIEDAKTGLGTFVIHKPATGCPDGWTQHAGMFTKSDGSKYDACATGSGQPLNSDYVDAGEGMDIIITVPRLLHEKPII